MTTLLEKPRARAPAVAAAAGGAPVPAAKGAARRQALWLAAAFPFAFLVPLLLADVADLQRDTFLPPHEVKQ